MHTYVSWRSTYERLGISHVTLWRWIKAGRFPKPVQLGPRRIAFIEADIKQWEAERVGARN